MAASNWVLISHFLFCFKKSKQKEKKRRKNDRYKPIQNQNQNHQTFYVHFSIPLSNFIVVVV